MPNARRRGIKLRSLPESSRVVTKNWMQPSLCTISEDLFEKNYLIVIILNIFGKYNFWDWGNWTPYHKKIQFHFVRLFSWSSAVKAILNSSFIMFSGRLWGNRYKTSFVWKDFSLPLCCSAKPNRRISRIWNLSAFSTFVSWK